jgi:hypothetical protein
LSVASATDLATVSQAPKGTSSDLGQLAAKRHLTSGIDWAIAGAATDAAAMPPVAAMPALMKLRLVTRVMGVLQ